MACISISTVPSKTLSFPRIRVFTGTFNNPVHISGTTKSFSVHYTRNHNFYTSNHNFPRLLFSSGESHRPSSQITYAVDSVIDSSISSNEDIVVHFKKAKVRVDLTGI
ncbi:hypothetical protein MKX01_041751 [Papaver californicum]|nr:hypothetical protein MKX01_041751 [Papaver californicum]